MTGPRPSSRPTGIVLAGGRATRFGGDKLAAPLDGMPLLHHVVLRLAEVCGEVVVSIAPEAPEPALPPGVPATFARDAAEGEGPLGGVLAALEAVSGGVALVAGGDMPDIATPVLRELVRVVAEAPVEAAVLADAAAGDDGYRPLPMALRVPRAHEVVHALLHRGERSLYSLTRALRIAVVDEPTWRALDPTGGTLRDVDRPEDLPSEG